MSVKSWRVSWLAACFCLFSGVASAADAIYTGWLSNTAVGGYDPIGFFDQGRPVKGSEEYALEWQGAKWLFASAENRSRFEANPEAFAPQFGGYCAYAVSKGELAKGDPQYWSVVDDKLYLNYSASVQETWKADQANYIQTAHSNWPAVLK